VAFTIRKITQADLDKIYEDLERYGWLDFMEMTRSFWRHGNTVLQTTIAVDDADAAYLWQFPLTRNDGSFRYLLGSNGQLAIVKELFSGHYSFLRTSNIGTEFMERAKSQIREALLIGGVFLQDEGSPDEAASVVDAQFTDMDGGVV
jgi:hypothetical protein